jgi:hypothetical protein
MANMQLHPGILWGQHRSSELIALGVKERLEKDQDIKKLQIPLIEFEEWEKDDYIALLFYERDMLQRGESEGVYKDLKMEFASQVLKYQQSLREKYGSLLFNLHDGIKEGEMAPYDIQFRIPSFIQDSQLLEEYLCDVSKQHNLNLCVLVYPSYEGAPWGLLSSDNIITEFLTPEPERLKVYPSEEIRKLAERFDPIYAECSRYKVPIIDDPFYVSTVYTYANFMKDVLIGLGQLEIR